MITIDYVGDMAQNWKRSRVEKKDLEVRSMKLYATLI